MRTFSDAPRFELLPDGTVYSRAGVQTNCGGIAGVHARISWNSNGTLVFTAVNNDLPHDDGYGSQVPGFAVPEPYREAIASGVREAFEEFGGGMGATFELIDALVHDLDSRGSKFQQAGWSAMRGWLAHSGAELP